MALVPPLEESLHHAARGAEELRTQVRDAKEAWRDLTRQLSVHQISMTDLRTELRTGLKSVEDKLLVLAEAVATLTVEVRKRNTEKNGAIS